MSRNCAPYTECMATENHYRREKVPDPDLRSFGDGDSDEQRSVLIELEVPPPDLLIGDRGWGPPSQRALAIEKRDDQATADRMTRLREKLVGILRHEPFRLDMAEAFVADVTPAELREVAQLGEVGQIRANRRHQGG